MDTRKFIVSANKKPEIEAHFIKLNKRATRLNLPNITWVWGPAIQNGERLQLPLDITGALSISYNGWSFAATIQHLPTGENIFHSIVGHDIPTHYRTVGSECEHCKVKRYRKDTYLVFNKDLDEYIQVGSSCIQDFLGGNVPESILNNVTIVSNIYAFLEGMDEQDSVGNFFHIRKFLAHTSACIREYGWLSKSKAYEVGGQPTVSLVNERLYLTKDNELIDKDWELADNAIEWAELLSDSEVEESDYLYSIRAIVRSAIVESRTSGFAASIISAYNKAISSKQTSTISNHVGAVKTKDTFNLKVINALTYQGSYGTCYKYIFSDDQGNILYWNASNSQNLHVGEKYVITGTIKAHTEFKGVKQTQINYCKIL